MPAFEGTRMPGARLDEGCQLRQPGDGPCSGLPEAEVTDRDGETAWGCVRHASDADQHIASARLTGGTRPGVLIETYRQARDGRR